MHMSDIARYDVRTAQGEHLVTLQAH
jgi:hypothetical protein